MIRTNVAIRTLSPELVEFFYPNYVKTSEFSPFMTTGVIFDGDSKYLQDFRDNNIPYIYVKGSPEFDLTIPENLLNFVFDKWNKKPTKSLVMYFTKYDSVNIELENIAKQIWVTGKYTINEDISERMNNLYASFARGSTYDIIVEYTKLSQVLDSEGLFHNIKSFIKKSQSIDSIKNARHKLNAEAFRDSRGGNIQSALMSYLYSPTENDEIKMLKLFDELTNIRR